MRNNFKFRVFLKAMKRNTGRDSSHIQSMISLIHACDNLMRFKTNSPHKNLFMLTTLIPIGDRDIPSIDLRRQCTHGTDPMRYGTINNSTDEERKKCWKIPKLIYWRPLFECVAVRRGHTILQCPFGRQAPENIWGDFILLCIRQ